MIKTNFLLMILLCGPVMAESAFPIRLACDQAVKEATPVDLNTGASPVFVRGDDLEIQLGFLQNGAVVTNWTNIASVTLAIFQDQDDINPPMLLTNMLATAPGFNPRLTQANWTNGAFTTSTNQSADFFIPSAQSLITLNGQASQTYWLRVYLSTTDSPPGIITAIEGPITVMDGPISALSAGFGLLGNFIISGQFISQPGTFGGYVTNGNVTNGLVGCYAPGFQPSDVACSIQLTNLGFYSWAFAPDGHSVILATNYFSHPFARPPTVYVSPGNWGYADDYYANRGLYAAAWCDPALTTTNYCVISGAVSSPAIGVAMHETSWQFNLLIIGTQ